MQTHQYSADDLLFCHQVESGAITPHHFNHSSHLRLAYIYLCDLPLEQAAAKMRRNLIAFLSHHGIDPAEKYHTTLTQAWLQAMYHFMVVTPTCHRAEDYLRRNSQLLDSQIMLSHYSQEYLFSDLARATFVAPNLQPIPLH